MDTHETSKINKIDRRLRPLLTLLAIVMPLASSSFAAQPSPWTTVFEDRYDYSKQSGEESTFNAWFWREDSAATHQFEDTSTMGCSANRPCVKLTAQAYPANTDYTNAEMYNNSCIKGEGQAVSQQLATLNQSAWGVPLYNRITAICDIPYPYQSKDSYLPPFGLTSSWTNITPSHLEPNPLAWTPWDVEAPWKAIRDITFNNPYLADENKTVRLTTEIMAETGDQGGSRGWGFWNTSMYPDMLQLAWFMEHSVPEAYLQKIGKEDMPNRGVAMQTIGRSTDGKTFKICSTILPPEPHDIYKWQTYRIEWRQDAVQYFVGNELVADHRDILLDKPMAFHNWVDNRNYSSLDLLLKFPNFPLTKDKTNYIRSFIAESASTSSLDNLAGSGTGTCQTLTAESLGKDILKAIAKTLEMEFL